MRSSERFDDFGLAVVIDAAVAGKRGQHIVVAQILRPSFVFLWSPTSLAAK